ncbi:hypothetical protein DICVIV_08328 [Dictyocaulus viviparus]|uniref:Uncharacterized protein n=1 Tax=Dictyocaulus viviparus TaxID=29172 RepID=A0A0D8XPE1_DICVI|nr:hypothetical protein DICVIV_08328 [Dictyocaulus viviparus]
MKPKRRSTFSPSVETTLRSPRPKRRRLDSSSPTPRISSNSSEDVKPPPEFMPFPYEKICPKFHDLLSKNSDDITLERDDLLCLQHELERMLAHSADYLRRAHGEVTYLSTGDYPVQDLRARPMPSYKLREFAPISPSTTHELQERLVLCGLPEDDVDDDLDVWPPQHIPQRFWTWCKADFLTPIDAEYLRDFKALLIDKYSPEEMKHYYVNEPWKHRKRQHGRPRINTADVSNSRPRRKSSTDGNLLERKNKDKDEKKASGLTSSRASRGTDLKLTPLINDLVCAANRETRKDDSITPSRRSSVRLQSRDDCEEERKISVKSELSEVMGCDNISDPHDNSHINGLDSRSPLNTRLHSPRIKKESREEANQDWDRPGPSNSFGTNVSNGRFNGELKTKLKRNGEMKRENGFHSNTTKLDSPTSTAMSIIQEDGEIEQHYREIGGRIVKMLVDRGLKKYSTTVFVFKQGCSGLIPSSTEHVYREIAQTSAHREINISQEGKEQDDDSDLDEVSQELLRCQTELQELEPRLRGVISHCWSKVCGDFAYWETMRQLDDADNDLFQLGMNLYHEHPSRRVPTNTELPTLRTALCRRNRKARQHYGPMYKRLRKYRKYSK